MFVTRRWLDKFIDLASVKNEEITVALNSLGFEVDAFRNYGDANDRLVIGHVGSATPIEGTHLNFAFVDTGADLPSTIVCGASNVAEGQFVITALPGTKIANGLTIEAKTLRGKNSEGMICALTELGMESSKLTEVEQDWIYEIYTKAETYDLLGQDALEVIGFNDAIWDVDLTLNRSDALAAIQIAKELANYFGLPLRTQPEIDAKKQNFTPQHAVKVTVDRSCQKAVRSLALTTIAKKEVVSINNAWTHHIFSEDDIWLKNNGAKTTNNFWLDLANIIAIETGQPILFLDPAKITTDLVITDAPDKGKTIGLKLQMGDTTVATFGVETDEKFLPDVNSHEVMVVMPSLDPIMMRKQQKAYNISNIAMQRFMKPVSSRLYDLAYTRLIFWTDHYDIMAQISTINVLVPSTETDVQIDIEQEFIDNLLGVTLQPDEIVSLFPTLGFKITVKDNIYSFTIDQNRTDISMKADIVEEIARLYGYYNIAAVPPVLVATAKTKQLSRNLRNQVEGYLQGQMFANIKTYSLWPQATVNAWDLFSYGKAINLASPLSTLRETYRLSLLPAIIDTVIFNSNKGNRNVKLYELADVYNRDNLRERHLSLAVFGDVLQSKAYNVTIKNEWSYVKGLVEGIIQHYNIDAAHLTYSVLEHTLDEMHPFINAKISYDTTTLGFMMKLNPLFEQAKKLEPTFVAELNLSALEKVSDASVRWHEVSKFQKTSRDLSLVLKNSDNYASLIATLTQDVKYLDSVYLADIYVDEAMAQNDEKSFTITFVFNDLAKQLTDDDVNAEFNKIVALAQKQGLVIR